jgi:hypothetical protein
MDLLISLEDLKQMNKATFAAFIDSQKYAYTITEAYKVFGRGQIDTLINHGLLKDTSDLPGKRKFLLSDIITAFKVWEERTGIKEGIIRQNKIITKQKTL